MLTRSWGGEGFPTQSWPTPETGTPKKRLVSFKQCCGSKEKSVCDSLLPSLSYLSSESPCVYQVPLQLAHLIGKWFFPFSQPYNISYSSNNIYIGQDTVLVLCIRLSRLLEFNHIFFFHAGYKLFEDRDWILSCVCSFQYWVHCPGQRTFPINFIELNWTIVLAFMGDEKNKNSKSITSTSLLKFPFSNDFL